MIDGFAGTILVPGAEEYPAAATAYGVLGSPVLVARPSSTADVAAAIGYARAQGLPLSVRSGGHTLFSTNNGGMVLDLAHISDVEVLGDGLVRVGGGAVWGDVARALQPYGLAISSGDTYSVGVGGLTLGGGIGWMVRQQGLALDNLREAEVVLPSGAVVTASDTSEPELFWALRGGGGNFGVVTEFTFEAHPLDGVVHGTITFDTDDLAALLCGYRDVMRSAPEELNVTFMQFPPMGPEMPGGPALHVVWGGADLDEAMAHIQPLLDLAGVVAHDISAKAYVDTLEDPHAPEPGTPMPTIVGNNGWMPDFSDEAIAAVVAMDESLAGSVLMTRYLRGEFNRVAEDATAFAWRNAEALVISMAFLPPDAPPEVVDGVHAAWQSVERFTEGTYGNFQTEGGERIVGLMYPAATRARLGEVKRAWDPNNLFSQNQNILPA